jgi:hypothetical protein
MIRTGARIRSRGASAEDPGEGCDRAESACDLRHRGLLDMVNS